MTLVHGDRKLPTVQALRGIAASLVVFFHAVLLFKDGYASPSWIYRSGLSNLATCGVDIFFVISGFIMVYTTRKRFGTSNALTFIKRRALRIYPLYWVWTSLFLALWLVGVAGRQQRHSLTYIICSYLLIPSFNGMYFHPLLVQGWTLSFEMLFYLVFACAILLKLRSGKILFFVGAFSTLALFSRLFPADSGTRYFFTNPIIIEFLYGVLVAEILLRLPAIRSNFLGRALPIALMGIGTVALLCTVKLPNADSMRFAFYGIPAIFVVLGGAMLGSASAPRLLVYLGDSSYSIYLAHEFFAVAYASVLKHMPSLHKLPSDVVILLAGVATIALSSFTYPLIEQRLLSALSTETHSKPAKIGMDSASIDPANLTSSPAELDGRHGMRGEHMGGVVAVSK